MQIAVENEKVEFCRKCRQNTRKCSGCCIQFYAAFALLSVPNL